MTKLILTFRDTTAKVEPYTIKFRVKDTLLARNWISLLEENILKSTHVIEKSHCLKGWVDTWDSQTGRNLTFLCKQLNKNIKIVNKSMVPLGYPLIKLDFTLENLQSDKYREMMNEIHHHFELLRGDTQEASLWYKKAPDDTTRTAILMLNNLCHEIEGAVGVIRTRKKIDKINFLNLDVHPQKTLFVGMNGTNEQGQYYTTKITRRLTLEEFKCFQKKAKWGDVSLYYAQIGKPHMDAYLDKDKHINRENISSFQFITGEFVVEFSVFDRSLSPFFKRWCRKHNFDYNDPTLGIGYPVVAEIENPEKNKRTLNEQLNLRNDLYQIGIETDNGDVKILRTFEHTREQEESWHK